MPENDAKWLADKVLLPKLEAIDKKLEKQGKCMTDIKVNQEKHSGRMELIERDVQDLKDDCDTHTTDKSLHYNPHFNETKFERLKRKKTEIVVTLGGSGGIGGLIILAAKFLGLID